jgi:serine/threonine-protein kinase
MSDLIGNTLLSQYRVDAFIAAGGMGAVYRVWDLKRNVPLAMKVLHAELADDPSMFKRFQREGRALQKLAHPNIVPFYGLYQTMDFAFMLERFVDGPSLKDALKRTKGKPLPLDETLVYMKALCAALGYAHANGVVHCDVKPGNIMLDSGGSIYLTDFGIARHAESTTTTMGAAGTPAYMPPEQILGQAVTPATDVYSLGVILYEMLTAQRPFRGSETSTENSGATINERIRYGHLHVPAQDPREIVPAISEDLAKVVLKALCKDPSERYPSTPEFFEAVCKAVGVSSDSVKERVVLPEFSENRDYATGQEVVKGATPQVQSQTGRSPALIGGIVAAGILGCVVLVAIGALLLSGGNDTSAEPISEPGNSASSSQELSQPNPTSIPTYTRPASTSTPDFAVRTAKAILTQAAVVPTKIPTSIPSKTPSNKPMFTLSQTAFCRVEPHAEAKDVTAFYAGDSFPILAWDPDGWWLVRINITSSSIDRCWIGGSMGTPSGAYSAVKIVDR